jgi:hypothetical protein
MHLIPGALFTIIGDEDKGQLNDFSPKSVDFSAGGKLRKFYYATSDNPLNNPGLEDGFTVISPILEELYACNLTNIKSSLDLADNPSLLKLDATNSSFPDITIANNAPVQEIIINSPVSLKMDNLYDLQTL